MNKRILALAKHLEIEPDCPRCGETVEREPAEVPKGEFIYRCTNEDCQAENDDEGYLNDDEVDFCIDESTYDNCIFDADGGEYMVLTEYEATQRWEESLNNYLEEYVYPELPEMARNYFDDDAWKRDARMNGRGHSLSYYDGNEDEIEIDGTYFYIYRVN